VPSNQLPSMNRIEPGDPDNSYIWRKISNTHIAAGGAGNRMPPSGGGLPLVTREIWETWIFEGAVP
ncbi:MAG: hypothetical protein AAF602_19905, partial [Myxococcota bacterium]